jgi:phenylacetate-CoA ligase
VRSLEDSQWWSPSDLQTLSEIKLRELLDHAGKHTEFYRRRFRAADIPRRFDDPFAALHRLPLLDKRQIRSSAYEMLWKDAPGGCFPHSTGGSTGETLQFYVDRRRQACDQAARIRTHRWFGVELGHRELLVWGSPIERNPASALKRARDRLFRQRLLDAFQMSPSRMDQYLEVIERWRPECLFGYPSSLALLAEHGRRGGRVPRNDLGAVFVTGEVCYPHQRNSISDFWGAPVADGYGSREAGFIAHQCPAGRMHISSENVIVEIFRDGNPVPTGETGEIVITHLDAYAMPMIRYRTGDKGRLLPGRCSCGRGLPMMDVVQGRVTDFLYLPDGTVKHALSLIYPLREMPGIRRFRAVQHEDYSVTLEVVPTDKAAVTEIGVLDAIRPALGHALPVNVQLVEEIPAAASGKHRYVVSQVKKRERDMVTVPVDV